MSRVRVEIRVTAYADPLVRSLEEQVQAEYVVRYGGGDATVMVPEAFDPPAGVFLIGWVDGEPVVCGGFRAHGPDAELKRMFVPAGHRGKGYARAILAALEETARSAGYPRVILETGTAQPEAIALYTSSGYTPLANFGFYKEWPHSRCFGKLLA